MPEIISPYEAKQNIRYAQEEYGRIYTYATIGGAKIGVAVAFALAKGITSLVKNGQLPHLQAAVDGKRDFNLSVAVDGEVKHQSVYNSQEKSLKPSFDELTPEQINAIAQGLDYAEGEEVVDPAYNNVLIKLNDVVLFEQKDGIIQTNDVPQELADAIRAEIAKKNNLDIDVDGPNRADLNLEASDPVPSAQPDRPLTQEQQDALLNDPDTQVIKPNREPVDDFEIARESSTPEYSPSTPPPPRPAPSAQPVSVEPEPVDLSEGEAIDTTAYVDLSEGEAIDTTTYVDLSEGEAIDTTTYVRVENETIYPALNGIEVKALQEVDRSEIEEVSPRLAAVLGRLDALDNIDVEQLEAPELRSIQFKYADVEADAQSVFDKENLSLEQFGIDRDRVSSARYDLPDQPKDHRSAESIAAEAYDNFVAQGYPDHDVESSVDTLLDPLSSDVDRLAILKDAQIDRPDSASAILRNRDLDTDFDRNLEDGGSIYALNQRSKEIYQESSPVTSDSISTLQNLDRETVAAVSPTIASQLDQLNQYSPDQLEYADAENRIKETFYDHRLSLEQFGIGAEQPTQTQTQTQTQEERPPANDFTPPPPSLDHVKATRGEPFDVQETFVANYDSAIEYGLISKGDDITPDDLQEKINAYNQSLDLAPDHDSIKYANPELDPVPPDIQTINVLATPEPELEDNNDPFTPELEDTIDSSTNQTPALDQTTEPIAEVAPAIPESVDKTVETRVKQTATVPGNPDQFVQVETTQVDRLSSGFSLPDPSAVVGKIRDRFSGSRILSDEEVSRTAEAIANTLGTSSNGISTAQKGAYTFQKSQDTVSIFDKNRGLIFRDQPGAKTLNRLSKTDNGRLGKFIGAVADKKKAQSQAKSKINNVSIELS